MQAWQPRFHYDDGLVALLLRVEAARAVVDVQAPPPDVGLRLAHEAKRRATHHSTAIEGNRLSEEGVARAVASRAPSPRVEVAEVRNYWRALEWIERRADTRKAIDQRAIRELHAIILPRGPGRARRLSAYRDTEIGVIDASTRAYEYMAPAPRDVEPLMQGLERWLGSERAATLPAPLRSAILAHRFVTIHPFGDGNGRTARALATLELWRSGYGLRGFLSVEEHYTRDLGRYYRELQMGLPPIYYEGRHDPDLTPWLRYFCETLAAGAEDVAARALQHRERTTSASAAPWEALDRTQQQVLSRCLGLWEADEAEGSFTRGDIADWFGVDARTAAAWLAKWRDASFIVPAGGGQARVTAWQLAPSWQRLIREPGGALRPPGSE